MPAFLAQKKIAKPNNAQLPRAGCQGIAAGNRRHSVFEDLKFIAALFEIHLKFLFRSTFV